MSEVLKIYTDGGARGNPGPAAIGVVVYTEGKIVFQLSQVIGKATNNQAEYQAFLASLNWLLKNEKLSSIKQVEWFLDSKLVVEQLQKNWKIKQPHLKLLAQKAWAGLDQLPCVYQISHLPREQNQEADALVNQALDLSLDA